MNNPCKECIVTTMCKTPCDGLKSFFENNTSQACPAAADCFRSGAVIIVGNVGKRASDNKVCFILSERLDYNRRSNE